MVIIIVRKPHNFGCGVLMVKTEFLLQFLGLIVDLDDFDLD
jgi:hypothetical protein